MAVYAINPLGVTTLNPLYNIGLGGATPTASLNYLYGSARTLEFAYNPGNIVSTRSISIGLATGINANSMAFIKVCNSADPFAANSQIYFEGNVAAGQEFYAGAPLSPFAVAPTLGRADFISALPGSELHAYVFASQGAFLAHAAPIQSIAYNTCGSQAIYANDQVGSLKVVGYIGSNGGYLTY